MTSIAQTYRAQTLFIYGLFAIATLSVVSYLLLTVATIFATSHRSSAVHQSAILVSEISSLEQSYLTLQARVNPSQAVALGLVAPATIHVVSLGGSGLSLRN